MSRDLRAGHCWQSSPATCIYERQQWERTAQLLAASKPTQGDIYAVKRILAGIPYAPQSHSDSPYLDFSLFRFDERCVSSLDRYHCVSRII